MTRYRLFRFEPRSPIGREYLHSVDEHVDWHLCGILELPSTRNAINFTPAETVIEMHKDKRLIKEKVKMKKQLYLPFIGYNWTDDKDLMFLGAFDDPKAAGKALSEKARDTWPEDDTDGMSVMEGQPGETYNDDGDRIYGLAMISYFPEDHDADN